MEYFQSVQKSKKKKRKRRKIFTEENLLTTLFAVHLLCQTICFRTKLMQSTKMVFYFFLFPKKRLLFQNPKKRLKFLNKFCFVENPCPVRQGFFISTNNRYY